MSTAREHAVVASELLDSLDRFAERLRTLTPDEHLQAVASGGIQQANRNMQFTIDLAAAHAAAAQALTVTETEGGESS